MVSSLNKARLFNNVKQWILLLMLSRNECSSSGTNQLVSRQILCLPAKLMGTVHPRVHLCAFTFHSHLLHEIFSNQILVELFSNANKSKSKLSQKYTNSANHIQTPRKLPIAYFHFIYKQRLLAFGIQLFAN